MVMIQYICIMHTVNQIQQRGCRYTPCHRGWCRKQIFQVLPKPVSFTTLKHVYYHSGLVCCCGSNACLNHSVTVECLSHRHSFCIPCQRPDSPQSSANKGSYLPSGRCISCTRSVEKHLQTITMRSALVGDLQMKRLDTCCEYQGPDQPTRASATTSVS